MDSRPIVKIHSYSDGTSYKGPTLHGLRHGNGKQVFVDGSIYIGSFSNGLADGMGILTYPNGPEYIGFFVNGKFGGTGKFTLCNGETVAGNFMNGQLNGLGIYTSNDETKSCQGAFKNGKFMKEEDCSDVVDAVHNVINQVMHLIEECKQTL